jgi:succinate dehydrogenase hydrophobic anchor subunit
MSADHATEQVRYGLWDKIWRDRHGQIVIWQFPNKWLFAWAGLTLISLFLHGGAGTIVSILADIFLAVWALLELFQGVNYFRRGLGLVILIFTIASLLKNF